MASSFLNPWASEFRQELILNDSGSIDSLQDTVQRVGLDFIQAYMDQIFNSHEDHRPVIGDLIKTPSRKKGTTTSKRTRANAQADKDKLDKIKSANIKKDSSTDKENAASPAAASARVVKITSSQPFQAAAASSSSNNNNNKSPPLSPLRIGSSRTNNNTLLQQLQQVQPDSPQKKDALVKPVKEKGKKKKVKAVVEEGDGDDNEVAAVVAEQSAPVVVKKTKGGKVAKSGTVAAGGKKKKGTKKEKVVEPEPEPEVVEDEEEILLVVEEEEAVEVPSVEEVEMQEQEEEEEKVQAAAVVVRSRPATPPLVVAAAKPIPAVVEVDFAPQSAPAESQQAEDPVVVTAQDEEEEEEEIVPAVVAVAPEDIAIPSSELSPVEEEAPSLVVEDKAISLEATFVKPVATPSAVVPSRTPPTTAVAVSAPVAPAKEDSIDSSSPPPVSTKSSKVPTPVAALQQPAAVNSGSKTPYLPSSANASTWSARGGGSTSIVGLRSSWLSKALGGASDAPEGLRKSQGAALVAASREREKEREEAAIVARASAAASASAGPSSTHKRKSGDLAADASSTSFDQNQSQNSQYDDLNRRATKLPRVDDHATSSHPLSTLPSASTIPGRLPIMFSPPGAASTAADNHSGISRLKKEIEDLAAKTARSRALSSIGGPTTTAPIPSLRMSLAQRPAQFADVAEAPTSFSQPIPAVASVPAPPIVARQQAVPIARSPEVAAEEEMEEEEEDEDHVPEPPMPDLATPFQSPVFGLLPPRPVTVQAPQVPLTPPPAPKTTKLVQEPVVAQQQASSSSSRAQAPQPSSKTIVKEVPKKVVEPEVFTFPSSPIEEAAPAPLPTRKQQQVVTPARQQPVVARPQQERTAVAAPPSRQQSRSNTPVFDDHHSAALLRQHDLIGSTTPSNTPPPKANSRSMVPLPTASSSRLRGETDERELTIEDLVMTGGKGKGKAVDEDDIEQEQDELADEEEEAQSKPRTTRLANSLTRSNSSTSALGQSTSNNASRLGASTSSQSVYAHGSSFAAKTLGNKPKAEPVKALALAAEAAKKEQAQKDRKAAISRLAEARRNHALVKKREEEKAKADEEKRLRNAELADRKARAAELEKKRKEREEKERKAKAQADEEASKKRKLATSTNTNEKVAPEPKRFATSSSNGPPKVLSKIAKPIQSSSSSSGLSNLPPKPVVPSFRHLPPVASNSASSSSNAQHQQQRPSTSASTSTIRAVPATMGPPIRTSDMNRQIGQPHHQQQHRPSQAQGGGLGGQSILQAQRQALQSHIAAQSEEAPGLSEAIELPDIKSEYSDSDDEDRDSSKQALPSWAQSPEIRNALREQESHNPDDIFGPMKPLSMEEVFRARAGKFRARSSSANWGGTDRLTPQEESDYARRMGFK